VRQPATKGHYSYHLVEYCGMGKCYAVWPQTQASDEPTRRVFLFRDNASLRALFEDTATTDQGRTKKPASNLHCVSQSPDSSVTTEYFFVGRDYLQDLGSCQNTFVLVPAPPCFSDEVIVQYGNPLAPNQAELSSRRLLLRLSRIPRPAGVAEEDDARAFWHVRDVLNRAFGLDDETAWKPIPAAEFAQLKSISLDAARPEACIVVGEGSTNGRQELMRIYDPVREFDQRHEAIVHLAVANSFQKLYFGAPLASNTLPPGIDVLIFGKEFDLPQGLRRDPGAFDVVVQRRSYPSAIVSNRNDSRFLLVEAPTPDDRPTPATRDGIPRVLLPHCPSFLGTRKASGQLLGSDCP
jgi:hypothetical protein